MKKAELTKREKELLKKIRFGYTKLLHAYECNDFCEFVVYEAGDSLTYRVYDDGRVYER